MRTRLVSRPVFRRRSTQSDQPKPARLAWLNSAFAIWLLSTIFVSLGTWVYTLWQQNLAQEKARVERVTRLDAEIFHRFIVAGADMPAFALLFMPQARLNGSELAERALLVPNSSDQLYPEFSRYTMAGLVSELVPMLRGNEKVCAQVALDGIQNMVVNHLGFPRMGPPRFESVITDLQSTFSYRWDNYAVNPREPLAPRSGESPNVWCKRRTPAAIGG